MRTYSFWYSHTCAKLIFCGRRCDPTELSKRARACPRLGGKPKVYYAERPVCLGCHQNHAPIFAVQPWDESNSNPSVSILLRQEQTNFYGIPSFTGIDIPGLIGLSADRANLFSTYQLIWQKGCSATEKKEAIKCRANALFAALRYRLAADTHAGTRQDDIRRVLADRFRQTWRENWPTGLAIPSRELPDLDPFGAAKTYLGVGAVRQVESLEKMVPVDVVSVDDEFEPLFPRGPLEVWNWPSLMLGGADAEPSWMNKFIAGLGIKSHLADFFIWQNFKCDIMNHHVFKYSA